MNENEENYSVFLKKAVDLDEQGRYSDALSFYTEGIQKLLLSLKTITDAAKVKYIRGKAEEYISRAEKIKETVEHIKKNKLSHQHIDIKNDSTGYSYQKVFEKYLDNSLTKVTINDPYIRTYHQVQNFLRFTEVLISNCNNLKLIELQTTKDPAIDTEQIIWLDKLASNLQKHFQIKLSFTFSTTLHDRSIILSNGWILKIGRGLDYFKVPEKFCPGFYNLDLRPCYETTIDIYHILNEK